MKKCLKCNNNLPNIITINGKKHNICNRKFCLECSPFLAHNTKNLVAVPVDVFDRTHKICPNCKTEKTIDQFYKGKKNFTNCKVCHNQHTKNRQKRLKQEAVNYMGGKCQNCGYDKYIGALEFHHINPEDKEFSIGQNKLYAFDKIKNELDKCILLCSNCHKEFHGGLIEIPPK